MIRIDIDRWEEILITITRNKTRSLLTAFGVFWGIFMLVALMGGSQGMQDMLASQFDGFATNAGFMGLPAIQAILGDQAMLYGALFLLPLNCLMYGYGESLFRKGGFSLKKFMNGPMIASVIALVLCIFNVKLPYILAQTCTYIGNVTTPLSMMVIGAGLVQMDVKELLDLKLWAFTIFKMILLPLFYMFSLSLFHIDPLIENTLILIMCMPVASNSSVYALMYGEDATLASKAIFLTSVACVVTIPIVFILHTL